MHIGENCKREEKSTRVYIPRTSEKDFKVWIILAISTVLLQLVYTWYVSQHIQLIDRIKWMSKTRECSIRKRRKKALCWRWIGKNDFSSKCNSERLFFVDIHVKLESLFLERACSSVQFEAPCGSIKKNRQWRWLQADLSTNSGLSPCQTPWPQLCLETVRSIPRITPTTWSIKRYVFEWS